jgi:5-methylcytosine-specific restriction endonuclease McrA
VQIPPSVTRRVGARGARLVCDCRGTEYVARLANLLSKKPTLSCGCLNREQVAAGRARSDLVRLPEGRAGRNAVLGTYKLGARKRGFCWELTEDHFDRLIAQDCVYCGSPPASVKKKDSGGRCYNGDFVYNGIDRVDNTVGYTAWNVVTCCGTCNSAKKSMTLDEFMAWIARITEYHWFHPEIMPSRLLREVKG